MIRPPRALPLALALLSLSATPARAWDPEPLCAMEGNPAERLVEPLASYPPDVPAEEAPPPTRTRPAPIVRGEAICGPWTPQLPQQELAPHAARHAWDAAQAAIAREDWPAALMHLEVVGAALPAIADAIELRRAELARLEGDERAALRRFQRARELSRDGELIVRARTEETRALLRLGDRRALASLADLRERYPSLPQLLSLERELGRYHEGRGHPERAIETYRALLASAPDAEATSELATEALARLLAPASNAERDTSPARSPSANAPREAAARDTDDAADDTRERAQARLASLRGRGPLRRLPSARLITAFRVAADGGLAEELPALAEELLRRDPRPALRLELALRAAGTLPDAALLEWLAPLRDDEGELGLRARYFHAQTLARLGRFAEAERALLEIQRTEHTDYYGQWASAALRSVRAGMVTGALSATPSSARRYEGRPPHRVLRPIDLPPVPTRNDLSALAKRLEALDAELGAAFPWFARAAAFLHLGEPEPASHELYEALLAWRRSTGRSLPYAGLESVAKGDRHSAAAGSPAERAARRRLSDGARAELREVATIIDAYGAATGFGGMRAINARPRAHARLVEEAAAAHGLDPNLLYAVMRVESVYQAEIVSYVGAVGLCQIMPRTGRRIARARGIDDFEVDQLLDPATNLDFAAWYLRSLIERFDGRLPLAIAAYNGGPHNVRRWLGEHPRALPLDAFLEHIPFTQTHRYVQRVLGHYAAYRRQVGLPPVALSNSLPELGPDPYGF